MISLVVHNSVKCIHKKPVTLMLECTLTSILSLSSLMVCIGTIFSNSTTVVGPEFNDAANICASPSLAFDAALDGGSTYPLGL